MSKAKRERVRVAANLPADLVKQLDREAVRLRKAGGRGTRAEALEESIRRHFLGTHGGNRQILEAHDEMRREASRFKEHAMEKLSHGNVSAAKRSFLFAAARELEALALLAQPDLDTVKSAVIEAVMLLKDGVGFKSLPDVPGGKRTEQASA